MQGEPRAKSVVITATSSRWFPLASACHRALTPALRLRRPGLAGRWLRVRSRTRRERQREPRGVGGVTVGLVGDGAAHRQVGGVRRQQRGVRVLTETMEGRSGAPGAEA